MSFGAGFDKETISYLLFIIYYLCKCTTITRYHLPSFIILNYVFIETFCPQFKDRKVKAHWRRVRKMSETKAIDDRT